MLQSESVKQKRSQRAEADDAKAVTTARAIAEEKRIETAGFYALNMVILRSSLRM